MAERGDYRPIHSVLLDSPEFQALSKEARLLLFAVKLSLGPSGIGVLYGDQLCHRAGIGRDELERARQELEDGDWIRTEGVVWWLRNGLEFEPNLSPNHDRHRKSVQSHVGSLPKVSLVNEFARYYDRWFPSGVPFPSLKEAPKNHGSGKAQERDKKGTGVGSAVTETETDTETITETETETGGGANVGSKPNQRAQESSPPPPPPDDCGKLEKVVEFVGERHRGVVRAVAEMADDLERWAMAVDGLYGPGGTEERMMSRVPKDERPDVLATALNRYASDANDWDQRYFRQFVSRAVHERLDDNSPDFGDENHRDHRRREQYGDREAERMREKWEAEDAEAEEEMAELFEWWDELDQEKKQEIEEDARERTQGVPEASKRPILIGVMQEYREAEEGAEVAEGAA